jgi:hypothetical protein
MLVYKTRNYWIFGFCPLSGVLKTRKHKVSETGSVSVIRLAFSKGPNRIGVSLSLT